MLGAGLLGAVGTIAVLRGGDTPTEIVVAADDLQVGDRIERDHLAVGLVDAQGAVEAHFVPAADLDSIIGGVVTAPIATDSPVLREVVRSEAAPGRARAMSFSIAADRAVGGDLEVGDRIDVLAVDRDGAVGYALVDALVMGRATAADDAPLRGGTSDEITVTVAVDAAGAARLAAAIADGDVTVVRSTGAEAIDNVVWFDDDPGRADA